MLAVVVRLGLLVYTQAANPNPVWAVDSHVQLQNAVRILNGTPEAPAYVDDVGLRYVHVWLSPMGGPSLLRLQLLQVFLDSLLVFVAWRIGNWVGGLTTARVAAFLFAVFLPEAVLAVTPSYDVWATWSNILPLWLICEAMDMKRRPIATLTYGVLAGSMSAVLSLVRSTTIFFGTAIALWSLYFGRWRLGIFILAGWLSVTLPLVINHNRRFGEWRLVRGDLAQIFWTGVGQFPNAYGLEPTDASVFAFYRRLGGKAAQNSQESERLLMSAAITYVRDNPVQYIISVARRSFWIVFPRNYWGPWVDQWHPQFRDSLIMLSKAPFEFVFYYPVTAALGIVGRIVDGLILPIAMVYGIICLWRRPQLLALLPLLYAVATLGPLYVTPRNTTNAYAAILPFCAFGLIQLRKSMNGVPALAVLRSAIVSWPRHNHSRAVPPKNSIGRKNRVETQDHTSRGGSGTGGVRIS